jgi:hypothetical protein
MGKWRGGKAFSVFVPQPRVSLPLRHNSPLMMERYVDTFARLMLSMATHMIRLSATSAILPQSFLTFFSTRTINRWRW